MFKTVIALFCFYWWLGVAQADTVSTANCSPFSTQTNSLAGPTTATCSGQGPASSLGAQGSNFAAAQSDYGALTVQTGSMWALGSCPADCEPDSGAEAEFSQTAIFTGTDGSGTLVATFSFSNAQNPYQSAEASVDIAGTGELANGFDAPRVLTLTVSITFGAPVTISGSLSGSASDNDNDDPSNSLVLTDMQVLNANGNQIGDFTSLIQSDSADYVLSPEPGSFGPAFLGSGLLWYWRRSTVAIAKEQISLK